MHAYKIASKQTTGNTWSKKKHKKSVIHSLHGWMEECIECSAGLIS